MISLSPAYAETLGLAVRRSKVARLATLFTLFFFFLAAFATSAFAQEATIVGTVTDPSGASVANATITITNNDTGVSRTLPTNSDGQYVAPDLHIGHYTVRVMASGFKVAEQKGIDPRRRRSQPYRLQTASGKRPRASDRRSQRGRSTDR